MANLAFSVLYGEVQTIIGRTDLEDNVKRRVNWAYDRIAGMYPWTELESEDNTIALVEGDYQYAVPSTMRGNGIRTIRYIDNTASKMITKRALDDFDDDHPLLSIGTPGKPNQWVVRGTNIEIFPAPGEGQVYDSVVISAITKANPCAITTVTAHSMSSGDQVKIAGITASDAATALNGNIYTVTVTSTTAFTLNDMDNSDNSTASDGTSTQVTTLKLSGTAFPTALSSDSGTTILPRDVDEAIIYLAVSSMFILLQEEETASYWRQLALNVIQEVIGTDDLLSPGFLELHE